jgi:hypothetical protein
MATNISFPTSPTVGQVYTYVDATYVWNGTIWEVQGDSVLSGTSVERVAATATPQGVSFWDTDLEIPCYLEGSVWYNAAGGIIS